MKIGEMKIGQRLIFGAYGPRNTEPFPIVWLKAENDGRFISEYVLDRLSVNPVMNGNNIRPYSGSCLHAFLNSDSREFDAPTKPVYGYYNRFQQDGKNGFLSDFTEEELAAMIPMHTLVNGDILTCRVRVPRADEIFDGALRLRLFKRKGVRAQLRVYPSCNVSTWSYYCPYTLVNRDRCQYEEVDSMGYESRHYESNENGLRPVICLSPDTEIEPADNRTFKVKGNTIRIMKLPEQSGLFDFFFGLA